MRILFVLEYYYPHVGGVETLFKSLAEHLALRNEVTVVTSRLAGTRKYEILNKVRICRVSLPNLLRRYFFSICAIPAAVREGRNADIIHTTTYNGALPARVSAILNKKPAVITVHEVLGNTWENLSISKFGAWLHKTLEHIIISLNFNRIIAISNSTKNSLIDAGIKKEKINVIYCGLDYEFLKPKKHHGENIRKKLHLEHKFVYASFGRPGITKGIEYLISAVPLIANKIPNSKLMLVLSNDPKDGYERVTFRIKELCIEKNVLLLKPVERAMLPSYMLASDCVVVPSLTEGFGFTAAEACALGIPLVATNTHSLPEVVSGKYLLVKPRNAKAIAEAVYAISKGKYKETPLKKFTIASHIENHLNLYKELIKES